MNFERFSMVARLAARSERWAEACRAFLRNCEGASAIELAICLPLIAGMIVPVADLGMGAYAKMQVQNAAQAGAAYAMAAGFNQTNIESAVTNATAMTGISASPAPSEYCGCVSGTTISNVGTPPCSQTCASGTVGTYVSVSAQASYSTLFPYPSIADPLTLSSTSQVRIK